MPEPGVGARVLLRAGGGPRLPCRDHGTFAFRGDQIKLTYGSVAPAEMPAELQEILSRRPWKTCEQLIGPNRVTGFVRPAPDEPEE